MLTWAFVIILTTGIQIGVLPMRGYETEIECKNAVSAAALQIAKTNMFIPEGKVAAITKCFKLEPLPESHPTEPKKGN